MDSQVHYLHFLEDPGGQVQKRSRGITVAFKHHINGDCYAGISYCMPEDNFSRKVGRKIARDHMREPPSKANYPLKIKFLSTSGDRMDVRDMKERVMKTLGKLLKNHECPKEFRDMKPLFDGSKNILVRKEEQV